MLSEVKERLEDPKYRQGKGIGMSTMQKGAILRKCLNTFVPHCRLQQHSVFALPPWTQKQPNYFFSWEEKSALGLFKDIFQVTDPFPHDQWLVWCIVYHHQTFLSIINSNDTPEKKNRLTLIISKQTVVSNSLKTNTWKMYFPANETRHCLQIDGANSENYQTLRW